MVFKRGMPRKRDDCVERDRGWGEIERCMFYSGHGELMNLIVSVHFGLDGHLDNYAVNTSSTSYTEAIIHAQAVIYCCV